MSSEEPEFDSIVAEHARLALNKLDGQLFGLSEQERRIENIVLDFLQTKDGKCALLEGERSCGRRSTLQKVLKRNTRTRLRVINAGFVAADPTYQDELAKEDEERFSIFLVRDADKLLAPNLQKFLYTMVDKATQHSWLVFFSVSRQDFAQHLQKQATSRIPKVQISFDVTHDYKEYCTAMREFLMPSGTKCEKSSTYKEFIESLSVDRWLKNVFHTSNYRALKQIAAQLLMWFGYHSNEKNSWEGTEVCKRVQEILDTYQPSYNAKVLILKDQTMRSQCVFLCVWRLLHNKESEGQTHDPSTSYRNVFLEFKKLVNQYYSPLDVSSDIFVFRELDHLVKSGLLKADDSTNVSNTSFRKVWLSMNTKSVEGLISKLELPTRICDFFTSILK